MWDQWGILTISNLGKQRLPVVTFFHFDIVKLASWLGLSYVFSLQTTIAVTFEWEKHSFIDF